jgi:hypothetical protein
MQYFPTLEKQAPVLPPMDKAAVLNWKSFFLGIVTTIVTIAVVGALSFLFRRWKKRRNERELRRIASIDG